MWLTTPLYSCKQGKARRRETNQQMAQKTQSHVYKDTFINTLYTEYKVKQKQINVRHVKILK